MKLNVNEFALTHHTVLRGSHYAGSWERLIDLVLSHWEMRQEGFAPGVVEVPVPAEDFYAGLVDLREVPGTVPLRASFAAREGMDEEPMIAVRVPASYKARATRVRVVCYDRETLGDEASTDADWEIVTILAEATEEPAPMPPITMARNFLGLAGGTKGDFSAEDFAKSIVFWAQHAVAADE